MQNFSSLPSLLNCLKRKKFAVVFLLLAVISVTFLFAGYSSAQTLDPISQVSRVAVSESGSNIFVLNGDSTISIYDLDKKVFLSSRQTIPTPFSGATFSIIAAPSGNYFATVVADNNNFFLSIFETQSFISSTSDEEFFSTIIKRDVSGGNFLGMFSSDSKEFYLTDSSSEKVFVVNFEDALTKEIKVDGLITGIENDNFGKFFFLLTRSPNQVLVFKTADNSIAEEYRVGAVPSSILYNQTLNRVFVSNRGDDTVSVIDLTSKQISHVSVGPLPVSMTYKRQTGDVFVANNGDGTISIIRPDFAVATKKVSDSAYARSTPIFVLYSDSAQKLVAINSTTRVLHVFDPAQNIIIKEETITGGRIHSFDGSDNPPVGVIHRGGSADLLLLDLPTLDLQYLPTKAEMVQEKVPDMFASPHSITVDDDGEKIFVGNNRTGDITVLDGNTFEFITKIKVGPNPQVISLNQQTKKLYISDPVDNSITIIDTLQEDYSREILPIDGRPRSMYVNERTNTVYISLSGSRKIAVINGEKDEIETIIDLGSQSTFPLLIAMKEVKDKIYVADYGGDSVFVIDGRTNTVEQSIVVGAKPLWINYVPLHDLVYVTIEGEKEVVVIDPDTDTIIKTFSLDAVPYRVLYDDKGLVYIIHRKESVVTVFEKVGDEVRILAEKPIKYLGELDFAFNMIVDNEKKNEMYLTRSKRDDVLVVDMNRDEQDILAPQWIATILRDGSVQYNQATLEDETQGKSQQKKTFIVVGIVILVLLFFLVWIFRRRELEHPL